MRIFLFSVLLPLYSLAQGSGASLSRYQVQYTPIYSDDIEKLGPALSSRFVFGPAGSFSSTSSEAVSGLYSIKGAYSGSGSNTPYLYTDPAVIALSPNHPYRVTFQYKILSAPDKGFEVLFFSATGASVGNFLPSTRITGATGTTGTATLTNTLGPYSDYQVNWNIIGVGAISIDNIQITDGVTGAVVASMNANTLSPGVGSGLQLINGASIVTDPSLVIAGAGSVSLKNYGRVATVPNIVTLGASTTYIVEFQYRIVNPGSGPAALLLWFQPAGTSDGNLEVSLNNLLKNAPPLGTFSTGAQTAGAQSWVLNIMATSDSSVIIDNITVLRQDPEASSAVPPNWAALDSSPFPRLGRYMFAPAASLAQFPQDGIPPFTYTQADLERRTAFADVIAGLEPDTQAQAPAFVRTIHQLNPKAVFLPYRISEEQHNPPPPYFSDVSPTYSFSQSFADDWFVRDTTGNYIYETDYSNIHIANISPFCPIDGGQTFSQAVNSWLTGTVFPSGLWGGVFFDNLFGRINPHVPHSNDPGLLNYDWNRNGIRDETPASSSEMTRTGAIQLLQDFQTKTGGLELAIGNTGPLPDIALAPYVNGFVFECFNFAWNAWSADQSSAMWRAALDAYRAVELTARRPVLSVVEVCGKNPPSGPTSQGGQLTPTADDFQRHRLGMGTALLSNGFYFYGLAADESSPAWYDEYSVDKTGRAVEDLNSKGYLGQALTDAVELADGGTLIFSEDFEGSTAPGFKLGSFGTATVAVTHSAGEVLSGGGSLVISNPDHTTLSFPTATTLPGAVPFTPGNTYRIVFDWRVLETLDGFLSIDFGGGNGSPVYTAPGVVAGDSGTADFPVTMPASASNWIIRFVFGSGGKIAIDNVRVYQGKVGPWRRDFENGFVLVNPLAQPHTFSLTDLTGTLNRTGIHRIMGTQAPDVNNGQPVTSDLTLGPFDAIILLADRIAAPSLNAQAGSLAAAGSSGSIHVTAGPGIGWTAQSNADWITITSGASETGDGTVGFTVAANNGGARSGTILIGGQLFTIEQEGASAGSLNLAGSMPQIASAGGWDTSLTLVNLGGTAAEARLNFAADDGTSPWLPFTLPQQPVAGTTLGTTVDQTLGAGATFLLDTTGRGSATTGSAQLLANGDLGGFAIFTATASGQAAVVPLESRNAASYLLAFDNTGGDLTGVAIANLASVAATVKVVIRNDSGTQIGTGSIQLAAQGHTSFMLTDATSEFPVTAGVRGTLEFDTPAGGRISVLGLRANAIASGFALTSLPALAGVGTGGGAVAHIASGGGWQTTFTLVNTGTSAATANLNFYGDSGSPASWPLRFPQTGASSTANSVSQSIPPGGSLIAVVADSPGATTNGSAVLTTTGNIGGFAVFRYNGTGQESVVPLQAVNAASYVLAFDNTGNLATGLAIANIAGQAASVNLIIRDDTGAQIGTGTISLAAHGHKSFLLTDTASGGWAVTQGIRGTIEFDTPAGGQIAPLGLRAAAISGGFTITTIPVMEP